MSELIREAGPLFGPVLFFGAAALFFAGRYALTGERRALATGVGAIALTVLTGTVGLVGGIRRAMGVPREILEEQATLVVMGVKESTSCLLAALAIATLACLLLTVGAYRAASDRRTAARAAEATA